MTTLTRDAVPIGDDIEPVEESRVDVETRNKEEESPEEGNTTFEMVQKNPTSRKEQEPEDCGHADYRSWCVLFIEDRCAENHLQVEPLEKEERERTKSLWVSFDCILLCNADSTLEHENEPSPEVLQEGKTYSCVEAVVRVTGDIPLLSWILHFAMRFLNSLQWMIR